MFVGEDGIYDRGASCRGSGFANVAGLITPAELAAGVIPHALMFASGVNRSGGPVAPATESDGSRAGSQYVPEGARVRLRRDFDLSSYPAYLRVRSTSYPSLPIAFVENLEVLALPPQRSSS